MTRISCRPQHGFFKSCLILHFLKDPDPPFDLCQFLDRDASVGGTGGLGEVLKSINYLFTRLLGNR